MTANLLPTILPRPTAIIFDWDGTIVDSLPFVNEAINHTRVHFGMSPQTLKETHEGSVLGGEALFRRDFGDEKWEQANKIFIDYVKDRNLSRFERADETMPHPHMMQGAEELLSWLQTQSDIRCAVLTNRRRAFIGEEIPYLGYDKLFGTLVCPGEAPQNKPSGAAALHVLSLMKIPPSPNVWLVGDTWGDIACANEAGLTGVLVQQDEYDNADHQPVIHLRNCTELLDYLRQYS